MTLISTVIMGVLLISVGLFIHVRLQSDLTQSVDAGLSSRAEQIIGALPAGGGLQISGSVLGPDEAFAQVLNADGSVSEASKGVANSVLLAPSRAEHLQNPVNYDALVNTLGDATPSRLLAVPVGDGTVVVVGASLEDQSDAIHRLTLLTLLGGGIAILISLAVGWVVAGVALRPVERMRREATEVSWSERLAVPGTRDELSRLAETLNDLLDRMESALTHERRLVSDTSHELRTPLANLKAELDLALRRPRDASAMQESLESAAEETDRLIRLTEDLLVLARADQGQLALEKSRVDLSDLAQAASDSFSARARERHVDIRATTAGQVVVEADPQRMRQVFDNVIENALIHTPMGSTIHVEVSETATSATVAISDEGPGFDPEFLPFAFDAFSRADTGRVRAEGGTGLGLAIIRANVQAHGGQVVAENRFGDGAVVTVVLPK